MPDFLTLLNHIEQIKKARLNDTAMLTRMQKLSERELEPKIRLFLKYMGAKVVYDILNIVFRSPGFKEPTIEKAIPTDFNAAVNFVDWKEIESEGKKMFKPAMLEAYNKTAEATHKMFDVQGSFDVINPDAVAWADKNSASMIQNIAQETKVGIRNIVRDSVDAGMGQIQIAKRLKGMRDSIGLNERQVTALLNYDNKLKKLGYGAKDVAKKTANYSQQLYRDRVKMIARTESVRASSEGYLSTLEQQKYYQEVEHIVSPGACTICTQMAGNRYDIRDAHGHIPVHPNCRCGWTVVVPKHRKPRVHERGGEAVVPRRDHLDPMEKETTINQMLQDAQRMGVQLTPKEAEKIYEQVGQFTYNAYADIRTFQTGGVPAFKKKFIKDMGKDLWDSHGKLYVRGMEKSIERIDKYLKVTPKFLEQEVYRGLKLTSTQKANILKTGNIINDKGFSSWTSDMGITGKFESNVILKIKNKKGVSVSHIAQFPEEAEILMPGDLKLKVVKSQNMGNYTVVDLEEVL